MNKIFPQKLSRGNEIRVVAPSRSFKIIAQDQIQIAIQRFEELGLNVTFAKGISEIDEFQSSSIQTRINDLHEAFADKNVKGIITTIGGFNCNQLLDQLDYNLIKMNPKIFCGYSDITALSNAIYSQTGLISYSGPHFSTFAMLKKFEFTKNHFKKCLFDNGPIELVPSEFWSDDAWYLDQENRNFIPNSGYVVINPGKAKGTSIGGNLCTFNLLHGTKYMPSLKNSILFIEDDEIAGAYSDVNFDRDLQSVLHLNDASEIKAILIGRFQKSSEMNVEKIKKIISSKKLLKNIPVIYGLDFGHTDPYITFPIGGSVSVDATSDKVQLLIESH